MQQVVRTKAVKAEGQAAGVAHARRIWHRSAAHVPPAACLACRLQEPNEGLSVGRAHGNFWHAAAHDLVLFILWHARAVQQVRCFK